jgi:hypothetical protein
MTTHDYPGETDYPPHVDAATAGDPRAERLVEPPTHDASGPIDTESEPSWQRHADQFAANRDHRDDDPGLSAESSSETSLFDGADLEGFRGQWDSVQAGFVDDPKRCVEQADGLVSDVVEQLSRGFAEARARLEQQWSRGEDASTEDLRVALKRYREFFDRLLAV